MTTDFLARGQDQIVGDRYRLGRVLHYSADGALYETEFGEHATPAVIRIHRGGTREADRLLAEWRNAAGLDHPNLIGVFSVGSSMLEDVPVIYVVMERADESLAGVLADRTLSEEDVRQLLTPTLSALTYLHNNGFAHAGLKPSSILATGEVLKLSIDSVTQTRHGGEPADDMWALGIVIVQALTREYPKLASGWGSYILRGVSEPFSDIVRHCLDSDPNRRWTPEEVAYRLEPDYQASRPVREVESVNEDLPGPVAAPLSPAAEQTYAAPVAKERRNEAYSNQAGRSQYNTEYVADDVKPAFNRTWLYVGIAVLTLIAIAVGFARNWGFEFGSAPPPSAVPHAVATPQAPNPSGTPGRSPAAALNETKLPDAKTPVTSAATPPAPVVQRENGWSVVVASYRSRAAAEKRERQMAKRWPKFKVSVLEERGGRSYYLVVLGRNLSQEEATNLRKRAVSSGLPRDTYVKRAL